MSIASASASRTNRSSKRRRKNSQTPLRRTEPPFLLCYSKWFTHHRNGGCSSGVERLTVAQEVAGSKPVTRPILRPQESGPRPKSQQAGRYVVDCHRCPGRAHHPRNVEKRSAAHLISIVRIRRGLHTDIRW